jgi:enterochelin esterase family protein
MLLLHPAAVLALWHVGAARTAPARQDRAADSIPELRVSQPVERTIRSGDVHRYRLTLRTGDFVRGTLDSRGLALNLKGLFPDGSKIRQFAGTRDTPRTFRFVAEAPGAYQLELADRQRGDSGSYVLRLEQVQAMPERLAIVRAEPYQSPRLDSLRTALKSGQANALGTFWERAAHDGTPLAEPIAGDDDYLLVTFLWRATFETYNVVVLWSPFTEEHPDDYQMARIADSDVWYKTLRIRKGARFLYQLSPNETLSRSANAQRFATGQVDPLNTHRYPTDPNVTKYEIRSVAALPGGPAQPWLESQPSAPKGKVESLRIKSSILSNERDISVYTPAGYQPNAHPYALLVLFDAQTYGEEVSAPTILDNLIAAGRIDPVVVVAVDYPPGQRDQELSCNATFADFVSTELIPWVRGRYDVSTDRRHVTIGGLSLGGLAAAYIALRNSEVFGNVFAQSGAFWWAPNRAHGEEPNWIARQYAAAPLRPIRFFLSAGTFENDILGSGGQILETTRAFRDVLRAKGNDVSYMETTAGHNFLNWQATLADGLIALIPPTK